MFGVVTCLLYLGSEPSSMSLTAVACQLDPMMIMTVIVIIIITMIIIMMIIIIIMIINDYFDYHDHYNHRLPV